MNRVKSLKELRIPTNNSNLIIRYVLKIGDIDDAIHTFIDLLGMVVLTHEEFEVGSPDGNEVHYDGHWSRTCIGYSSYENLNRTPCLQLTINYGIEKYSRGNFLDAIEIQVGSRIIEKLAEAGIPTKVCRGQKAYILKCDGYNLEVIKSPDGKQRLGRIILNCAEPITLSGPTVNFWTACLGFKIHAWSSEDKEELMEYLDSKYNSTSCMFRLRRLCFPCSIRENSAHKKLKEGEPHYVELEFGGTKDFFIRLQMWNSTSVDYDPGTGHEKIIVMCSKPIQEQISDRVSILGGRTGGSQRERSFQLCPGSDVTGLMAVDPNALEVVFYSEDDVMFYSEVGPNSSEETEKRFREFVRVYKKALATRRSKNSRGSAVRFALTA